MLVIVEHPRARLCVVGPSRGKHLLAAAWALAVAASLSGCQSIPRVSAGTLNLAAHVSPVPASNAAPILNALREEMVVRPVASNEVTAAIPLAQPDVVSGRADLWGRLVRGFSLTVPDDPLIERFARHFAAKSYFSRRQEAARRYLHLVASEIEAEGLPMELALLPLVESSLNPHAVSSAGAMGAWQFMPATAKNYDLRISRLIDERKNVQAATRAALRYLKRLHEQFGDWPLALAAYNWGEGNVARAIARNRAAGRAADYLSLRLPAETRNYVPQLFALAALVRDAARYEVVLPAIDDSPFLVAVKLPQDIDVTLAARFAGLTEMEFLAYNPAVRPPLAMRAATPQLLLPIEAAERFEAVLPLYQDNLASWSVRTLRGGARIESLANQYRVEPAQLRSVNNIPAGMRLAAGSTILVPATAPEQTEASEEVIARAALYLVPDVVRITVRARRGETPRALAIRLGVPLDRLRVWNRNLPSRTFAKPTIVVAYLSPEKAQHLADKKTDGKPGRAGSKRQSEISGHSGKARRT